MNRHYYISNNLDDLETLESELEANGINTEQIHVLSDKDADVEQHHLHDVNSFMKQDVVHSGEVGAVIGEMADLVRIRVGQLPLNRRHELSRPGARERGVDELEVQVRVESEALHEPDAVMRPRQRLESARARAGELRAEQALEPCLRRGRLRAVAAHL